MNFDAFLTVSSSPIEFPNYESDDDDGDGMDLDDHDSSNKRKQPKRAAKVGKVQSTTKNQSQEHHHDSTSRKMMVYQGNKFYRDRKLHRKLIWKCCTSRFTNCTAQLTTTLNGKSVILDGSHDHANNCE